MKIGFHASHEQYPPSELLRLVALAERAGFSAAMCSDHFAPFSARQGHSGFAWSWLGAALATTGLSFGTVSAPGYRYHPAVLAQGAATLAEMFPGRFWLALGSGEYINEQITGDAWPPLAARRERLRACAGAIKALLRGETVSLDGPVRVRDAKLWSRPATPPLVVGAAVSPESAARVASWADALVTVNQPEEVLRAVVRAFRENGGEGKPMYLQVHVAWAPDERAALAAAYDQWRANVFAGPVIWDAPTPEHLDAAARFVREDDVRQSVRVSSDLGQHVAWIARDRELGFDAVYLHEVGREQERFIDTFATHVLGKI
jgi:probable non-F420 flavinoid oxidoreductase